MTKPFRPMLACEADLNKLAYPLLASPKLDGVRAVVRDGVVYSRSNKPIPNLYVQHLFGTLEGYDGELIVGTPDSSTCYRDTVSGVMTRDGTPDVSFFVFDHIGLQDKSYLERCKQIAPAVRVYGVMLHLVPDQSELLKVEANYLDRGYEGLILRKIDGHYKQGRSTAKEGLLLKLKRFVDAEAMVVGFEERMHNANEATVDERGYTKRSSHQDNKVGRGDLGALVVVYDGIQFNIGSGFTDEDRAEIWQHQDNYLGNLVKFKYFPVGIKEAPRHPVFLGWRDPIDT